MGITLFGKNILQVYSHRILKIDYDAVNQESDSAYSLRLIDTQNLEKELSGIETTVTLSNLKRLIRNNGSLCEGFLLEEDHIPVATIWVLYKGTDDLEYRIRSIDAYLFDVCVNSDHRGKGIAQKMLSRMMAYLHEKKNIDTAYLAVSEYNQSAIRAYEKAGCVTVKNLKFTRFLKINIPYHVL